MNSNLDCKFKQNRVSKNTRCESEVRTVVKDKFRESLSGVRLIKRAAFVAVLTATFMVGMMAQADAAPTRFYLQNGTAALTAPAILGTWDLSTTTSVIPMARTKAGTIASQGVAETSATNNYSALLLRAVSEPIAPRTIAAGSTLNWAIGALENLAQANMKFRVHAYVVSNDGSTLRGTLLANNNDGGTEWPTTTAVGRGPLAAKTLTAVTTQANDRVIIEVGYYAANTSATSYTGTLSYGGTGGDMTVAGANTLTGWFEFSEDLFCGANAPTDLAAPIVTGASVQLTWTADLVYNNLGYDVYRNGVKLNGTPIMGGSFTDTTISPSTTYNSPGYQVMGLATCANSPLSTALPVTTPAIVNGTTVGALSYSAVTMDSMTVTAAYTGDDNNSNTCTIIYSTSPTYTPYSTAPAPSRVGKSWQTNISGLNASTLYYIRATFNDTDAPAVTNVNVNGSYSTTANPLIHTSANLGTKYGTWGTAFTCATCHVSGSTNIKRLNTTISTRAVSATNASVYGANNTTHTTSTNACEICHTQPPVHKYNQPVAVNHYNNDCISCHKHDTAFAPPACLDCHKVGNTVSAPVITAASPHVKADGITFGDCTDCHTGHYGAAGVNIVNNAAVGINYGHGGINLGGPGTVASINTKTTEAEICWGCHETQNPDISEWGTNTGGTYNYGSVTDNNLNWTTTSWSSANFSYKNGLLYTRPIRGNAANTGDLTTRGDASLHATGGTVGTPSNTLSQVRCSYCHDVHDSYGVAGKPYLRAAWRVNPYKEDGAPRSGGQTYSATENFGAVPRGGGTNLDVLGGWQIDINNGNPNSGAYVYATNDALCASCHTQTAIQTAAPLHKNSVKGFTNDTTNSTTLATNRNILRVGAYTGTDYHPSRGGTMTAHSSAVGAPRMGYNVTSDTGATEIEQNGLRDVARQNLWVSGYGIYNLSGTSTDRYAYQAIPLGAAGVVGVTQDLTTVEPDYHSFTCSKCHTPHASRLPRLMITNCLDVNNNTWDDILTLTTNTGYTRSTANNPANVNELAYFSSAQNCHRYTENAGGATRGTVMEKGWNAVTPW